jgi:hypothetical protein
MSCIAAMLLAATAAHAAREACRAFGLPGGCPEMNLVFQLGESHPSEHGGERGRLKKLLVISRYGKRLRVA